MGVLVSWLMGLYLMSTVLLMRMDMPAQYRQIITEAMGADVRFNIFYRWSDEIFRSLPREPRSLRREK